MRGKNICSPRRWIKRGFFSIHVHWTWVETYGLFLGVGRGVNFHASSSKKVSSIWYFMTLKTYYHYLVYITSWIEIFLFHSTCSPIRRQKFAVWYSWLLFFWTISYSFIPLGDNVFSYSYCRKSINFLRDNQTDVFRELIFNIIRIKGFPLAANFF